MTVPIFSQWPESRAWAILVSVTQPSLSLHFWRENWTCLTWFWYLVIRFILRTPSQLVFPFTSLDTPEKPISRSSYNFDVTFLGTAPELNNQTGFKICLYTSCLLKWQLRPSSEQLVGYFTLIFKRHRSLVSKHFGTITQGVRSEYSKLWHGYVTVALFQVPGNSFLSIN